VRGQSKISCPHNVDGISCGGARRAALLALHPRKDNDDYHGVTFLAEATRPADLIVVDHRALAGDSVSLVVCPVDYSENVGLTKMLGEITDPF